MLQQNKLQVVGIIVAAHGIKGEVIIQSFTSPITQICSLSLVNAANEEVKLRFIRKNNKNQLVCKVNDLQTRNCIEELIKTKIYCNTCDLPILQEDEFYTENLKNLKVLDFDHEQVGIIKNIYNFGAGDLIEIKFNDNNIELYPFTAEFFPKVQQHYVVLGKRI